MQDQSYERRGAWFSKAGFVGSLAKSLIDEPN